MPCPIFSDVKRNTYILRHPPVRNITTTTRRRWGKSAETTEKYDDELDVVSYAAHTAEEMGFKTTNADQHFPKVFTEDRSDEEWAEAIDREFDALSRRETWKLIRREPDMYPLSHLWKFKCKNMPGNTQKFLLKARCWLQGDKKEACVYFDTNNFYAPVARHETDRILLAKVGAQNLILEGADISNA